MSLSIKHTRIPGEQIMANPYHDETGRFCSKNEMQAAITKLATKGDLEGYFALRTEFEKIEKNQVVISKDAIRNLYNRSALIENLKDKEELSEIYGAVKDQLVDRDEAHAYTSIISFLESNMDEQEKTELIQSLPADTKSQVLNKIRNDNNNKSPEYRYPYTNQLIKNFAEGEINAGVVSELASSPFLTFEEKYIIANNYPNGLSILANEQPKLFFSEPLLRAELKKAAKEATTESQKEQYALALSNSPHAEDLLWAVENSHNWDYFSAIYRVRTNPNIDERVSKAMLKRSFNENLDEFQGVVQDTFKTLKPKNSAYAHIVTSAMWMHTAPKENTPEFIKRQEDAKAKIAQLANRTYASDKETRKAARQTETYQAIVDAGANEYKQLQKEAARHEKDRKALKADPAEWRAIKKRYERRIGFAQLYLRAENILQRLQG